MIKKCIGCGSVMQCCNPMEDGYVKKENFDTSAICFRCFSIKNYSTNSSVKKDVKSYQKIIDKIKLKDNLILFLVDIFSLDESITQIKDFKGKKILAITKKDILPKSIKESKIKKYIISNYNINDDIIFISSFKNYNLDELYNLISKYSNGKEVYLVGNTNAGKSTLINKLIKSYGNGNSNITTSNFPATTQELIKIDLNDKITLVDTPGLVNDDFLFNVSDKEIKRISIKKEIKPITFQVKDNESIIVDNYARLDYLGKGANSITIYISNNLKCKKISFANNELFRSLNSEIYNLNSKKDIVIPGLCFFKITNAGNFVLYKKDYVKSYERDNLI